jgi:hypothetical protein
VQQFEPPLEEEEAKIGLCSESAPGAGQPSAAAPAGVAQEGEAAPETPAGQSRPVMSAHPRRVANDEMKQGAGVVGVREVDGEREERQLTQVLYALE